MYAVGILKFGDFTLKDGRVSPYYLDLRALVSHPHLFAKICKKLTELIIEEHLKFDYIAGVPLAGVPIATLVSSYLETPGLLVRKEAKGHGLQRAIEGNYLESDEAISSGTKRKATPSQTVLLIDDLVTSTASKREIITVLEDHGLCCNDIVVIVDRRETIDDDLRIHSLFTMSEIIRILLENEKVALEDRQKLLEITK